MRGEQWRERRPRWPQVAPGGGPVVRRSGGHSWARIINWGFTVRRRRGCFGRSGRPRKTQCVAASKAKVSRKEESLCVRAGQGRGVNDLGRDVWRTVCTGRKVTTKKISSGFVVTLRVVLKLRQENRNILGVIFIYFSTSSDESYNFSKNYERCRKFTTMNWKEIFQYFIVSV